MTTGFVRSCIFEHGSGVPGRSGAYARATVIGDTLYVTGRLPIDPCTDALVDDRIVGQAVRVLNPSRVLARCGSSPDEVARERSLLAAESDFTGYDEMLRSWFGLLPSRTTCVVSGFANPNARIEIDTP